MYQAKTVTSTNTVTILGLLFYLFILFFFWSLAPPGSSLLSPPAVPRHSFLPPKGPSSVPRAASIIPVSSMLLRKYVPESPDQSWQIHRYDKLRPTFPFQLWLTGKAPVPPSSVSHVLIILALMGATNNTRLIVGPPPPIFRLQHLKSQSGADALC